MSRGWESKSVESQQASQQASQEAEQAGTPSQSTAAKASEIRGNVAADAEQKRRRQALELQRERILSERTASPHRRTALSSALTSIEEELAQLGWTLHL